MSPVFFLESLGRSNSFQPKRGMVVNTSFKGRLYPGKASEAMVATKNAKSHQGEIF